MSENENGFDPTKPARTRDGRDVILNSHLTGRVIGDDCPQFDWKLDGRHMWGNPALALVNVSPPVTNQSQEHREWWREEANAALLAYWKASLEATLRAPSADYTNFAKMEHEAEEAECARMALDDHGVPRASAVAEYSLVGRIMRYGEVCAEAALRAPASEPADASGMTPLDHEARAIFRVLWGHQFGGVVAYEDDEAVWKEAAMEVRKVRGSSASGDLGNAWQKRFELLCGQGKKLMRSWCNAPDLPEEMERALSKFEDALCLWPEGRDDAPPTPTPPEVTREGEDDPTTHINVIGNQGISYIRFAVCSKNMPVQRYRMSVGGSENLRDELIAILAPANPAPVPGHDAGGEDDAAFIEELAEAVNLARYTPEGLPPMLLAQEDSSSQEYARRLAKATAKVALARRAQPAGPDDGSVSEAASRLVSKLEEVDASPAFQAVWTFLAVHGVTYAGPNFRAELDALRAAIEAARKATLAPGGKL